MAAKRKNKAQQVQAETPVVEEAAPVESPVAETEAVPDTDLLTEEASEQPATETVTSEEPESDDAVEPTVSIPTHVTLTFTNFSSSCVDMRSRHGSLTIKPCGVTGPVTLTVEEAERVKAELVHHKAIKVEETE